MSHDSNKTMNDSIDVELKPIGAHCMTACIIGESVDGKLDIETDGRRVTLKPPPGTVGTSFGGTGEEYKFQKIFDSKSSEHQIYDDIISELMNVVSQGMWGAVLSIGDTFSGKSEILGSGDIYKQGIIPLAIEGLYGTMEATSQAKNADPSIRFSYHVRVSIYELYNETIQDLLNAQNRELKIVGDPMYGFNIQGTTIAKPTTAAELLAIFQDAWKSRLTVKTDYGPPRDHATAITQIDIIQVEQSEDQGEWFPRKLFSRLMFIDVAGTETLLKDPAKLRLTMPASLFKSIFGLQAVSKVLGASNRFTPYDRSQLTRLTMEALGGNCITVVLACLKQGAGESNKSTLELARLLQRVQNFPVCNTEQIQGLVRRFRLHIRHLQKQVDAKARDNFAEKGTPMKDVDGFDQEFEKKAHKEAILKLKEKMAELKDEKDHAFDQINHMREEFDKVTVSKGKVQMHLIEVEEEKLRVSKALLDVQIEANQAKQNFDEEKMEMVNKLIRAENDILALEMNAAKKHEGTSQLERTLMETQRDKRELQQEFITIKNNFIEVKEIESKLRTQLEEQSAQLLTEVNRMKVYKESASKTERILEEMKRARDNDTTRINELELECRKVKEQLIEERDHSREVLSEKTRIELELKQQQIHFSSEKVMRERSSLNFTQNRDKEFEKMRRNLEADTKVFEQERVELSRQAAKQESLAKAAVRCQKTLEEELDEERVISQKLKIENSVLEREVHESMRKHRLKLIALMEMNEMKGRGIADDVETSFNSETSGTVRDIAMDALLETFRTREKSLTEDNKILQRKFFELTVSFSKLNRAYRSLWYQVDDAKIKSINLEPLLGENDVTGDFSELEQNWKLEIEKLEDELRLAKKQISADDEKRVFDAERHHSTVRKFENTIGELQSSVRMLSSENEILKKSSSKAIDPRMLEEMKNLQKHLLDEISLMRDNAESTVDDVDEMSDDMTKIKQLKRHIKTLKHDAERLRYDAGGEVARLSKKCSEYEDIIEHLERKLKRAKKNKKRHASESDSENEKKSVSLSKYRKLENCLEDTDRKLRRTVQDLEDAERKLRASGSGGGNDNRLRDQVDDLERQLRNTKDEIKNLEQKLRFSEAKAQEAEESLRKCKEELSKRGSISASNVPQGVPVSSLSDDVIPLNPDKYKAECEKAKAAVETLQEEVNRLHEMIPNSLPTNLKDMGAQLKTAEVRIADALTNCAMAKSELKTYKKFMEKTTASFKKKEKKYKAKIKSLGG